MAQETGTVFEPGEIGKGANRSAATVTCIVYPQRDCPCFGSKNGRAIQVVRAAEQFRQKRELFDQRKLHEAQRSNLRLVEGYSLVVRRVVFMLLASYILLHNEGFPASVVVWFANWWR